ncbi:MAG: 50S ribosomal protein L11 [Nanoarchaeota archaeon]
MGIEKVEILIEGGKATAAPPLGPALGPMGVNIGQVVADVNKKTGDFQGMKVPVTVSVNTDTKEYSIKVGTPPTSELLKREAGLKKGAKNNQTEKVADLNIETIAKIARMKKDSLLGKDAMKRTTEILGACNSMGITIDGKSPKQLTKEIKEGQHKDRILSEDN